MNHRSFRSFRLLLLVLSLSALACDASDLSALFGGGGKPAIVITSPPSGSQFHEGEEVAIQSVSTDANGILRVELVVDGQIVRTDTLPVPQNQFALIQTWKATQGTHTILVRAYNTQSVSSDPAAVSIQVSPGTIAGGPGTPIPVPPTSTTAPGGPSPTTGPAGCTNNSAFVADVTIPDGATMTAGQSFTKIWRLSNSGTCTWGAGYQFVFVSGDAMTPSTVIGAPNTAPGATADISVGMTAPATPGTYTGQWRMRSSGGANFGQTVSVKISVPGAPPPPTNTTAPACPGPPVIASFTASPNPITAGSSTTLNWGAVSNATSASIDNGIGGVATPGSTSVSPPSTTTYTLTATGCGGVATSQVTVTVNPAPLAPVPVPTQQSPADGSVFRVFPRVAGFNWSDVSYPGGVKYNIEIQINTGSWQPFATANNLTNSNYTMSAFTGDNTGRWRVWATSPTAGDGTKSGWWDFSFNTSAAQYVATWLNDDSGTSGITRIIISRSGQTLFIHPYGKCHPTDCDWGTRSGSFNGEPFVITFPGPPSSQLTITLNNNAGTQLKVVEVSTGTFTYTFHK